MELSRRFGLWCHSLIRVCFARQSMGDAKHLSPRTGYGGGLRGDFDYDSREQSLTTTMTENNLPFGPIQKASQMLFMAPLSMDSLNLASMPWSLPATRISGNRL